MSKLLINESPLVVQPSLAVALGLEEAIVLQQIHYWLERATIEHKGRAWVYKTHAEWQKELPFFKDSKMRGLFANLKKLKLIDVEKLKKSSWDHTNYYSINYGKLAEIEAVISTLSFIQKLTDGYGNSQHTDVVKSTRSNSQDSTHLLTENTTETTPEIPSESGKAPANDYPDFENKVDDRFLNFLQLNITTLPNDWKADALAKYPELNEQSLTDMFNAFEANHKHETGRVHTLAQWRGRWGIWFAKDASMAIRKQPKAVQPTSSNDEFIPDCLKNISKVSKPAAPTSSRPTSDYAANRAKLAKAWGMDTPSSGVRS